MPFVTGQQKPTNSGRRKGTSNKSSAEAHQRVLSIIGSDPLVALQALADDVAASDPKLRFLILRELTRYCHSSSPSRPPSEDGNLKKKP